MNAQVPEETRIAAILHARMENYKKDQTGTRAQPTVMVRQT